MGADDKLLDWRHETDRALHELAVAIQSLTRERERLQQAEARHQAVEEAQQVSQRLAQEVQSQTYKRIAGVVSKCLEAVFDEPYCLQMSFVQRRGRTEVDLFFERGRLRVDPLTASGGGVVDVASFALRLACLLMSKPPLRRVLILDEPFRFVSAQYREHVSTMLETLAEEMGVQILMVTHIEELRTGKVIQLGA